MARLLGSSPQAATAAPVASVASRFALVGVVASRGDNATALIAVDGKPAKPFRVGGAVDEGLVLQAVEARRVILAASAEQFDGRHPRIAASVGRRCSSRTQRDRRAEVEGDLADLLRRAQAIAGEARKPPHEQPSHP